MSVLLIHPPVSKPCEPPPGIANLCGALRANGVRAAILDMNLGGLLTLIEGMRDPTDTWTRRAVRSRTRHLDLLRNPAGYSDFSTYKRAILDVNRLLQVFGNSRGLNLTLANYQSKSHSPLRSLDLIRSAENPEEDPFYPCFKEVLPSVLELKTPEWSGFP